MTMHEFLAEASARTTNAPDASDPTLYAGGLTRGQVEELLEWADE